MKQFLVVILLATLTSLYIFPFETVWMPMVNTKMALAAVALILLILNVAKTRSAQMNKSIFILSLSAFVVSMAGIISVVLNNTHDYVYASYFVKMWVWLGGAYVVVKSIEYVYGKVNVRLVGNFLILVAVVQCILAQLINIYEPLANFVDTFMVSTGYMGKVENRLYGIGCALDVAGIKFCAILIITAFFSINPQSKSRANIERGLYLLAFLIITLFGSMISRTTMWGVVLSIFLWIYVFIYYPKGSENKLNLIQTLKLFAVFLLVLMPFFLYYYRQEGLFYENFRFGFEGFVSLVEDGEWDVKSNRQLLSMVVWPDNLKTWLIGDGYFENPMNDYYYAGKAYYYYMGTDVGYCRFIFYFGAVGLLSFSIFMFVSAFICSKNNSRYAIVFWLILLMNFIVWIKVSSDVFSVFALFLWLYSEGDVERVAVADK